MKNLAFITLAAGLGKRMKSPEPKVLQKLCGKPLIYYNQQLCEKFSPELNIVILGHKSELVEPEINKNAQIVIQKEQLGTAHAVLQAENSLGKFKGKVIVLCGDVPLLSTTTLKRMIRDYDNNDADAAVLTAEIDNPKGYGRIVRNDDKTVNAIVEEKDADSNIKNINEINSGIYCFDSKLLFKYLPKIKNNNAQQEYYLTDMIKILVDNKYKVIAVKTSDLSEIEGINDRLQLAQLEKKVFKNNAESFLKKGVVIIDTDSTYIDCDSKISSETVIYPNTYIYDSNISKRCIINNSFIKNSEIKTDCKISYSNIVNTKINSETVIGNYNTITDCVIEKKSVIGSFNSLKKVNSGNDFILCNNCSFDNTVFGKNCYISNNCSICSFDKVNTHNSEFSDDVFIGAGCQFVSPVKIGSNSYITSGTTVIKNIDDDSLVMNRPKTLVKKGYAEKLINKLNNGE